VRPGGASTWNRGLADSLREGALALAVEFGVKWSVMNCILKFEGGGSDSPTNVTAGYIPFSNRNIQELESPPSHSKQTMATRSNRNKTRRTGCGAVGIKRTGTIALTAFLAALLLAFAPPSQAQATPRAKAVGQRMMCVCGCNEVLTACNHVGCTYSHGMLKEVDDRVARGDSDDLILQSFIQEYGLTVLVDPPKKGFTALVWIAPIVAPFLALLLIWVLVRRWRGRTILAPAGGPPISADMLDRARRESNRDDNE
jgi:cytochrome c-type biogenesis protein CcmH